MPGAADIIRDSVNEISRLQNWMKVVKDSNPDVYDSMHDRYMELKVTLSALGVNLAELNRIILKGYRRYDCKISLRYFFG